MAIDLFDRYPTETTPESSEYPFGSFRNRTAPTSNDGTKLEQDWSNDFFALHWRLLVEAGLKPNGAVDNVKNSQYFDALLTIIRREKTMLSDALNGTRSTVGASEKALGITYSLANNALPKSGGTMTGLLTNNVGLDLRAANIAANQVGAIVALRNENGVGTFRTRRADGSSAGEQVHRLPSASGTLALGNTASGAQNGWFKDTNTGIITQWGRYTGGLNTNHTFPVRFSSQCFSVVATINDSNLQNDTLYIRSFNASSFSVNIRSPNRSDVSSTFTWFAIGK